MSDMQFRAVRKRSNKSESEKATDSEPVLRFGTQGNFIRLTSDLVRLGQIEADGGVDHDIATLEPCAYSTP